MVNMSLRLSEVYASTEVCTYVCSANKCMYLLIALYNSANVCMYICKNMIRMYVQYIQL